MKRINPDSRFFTLVVLLCLSLPGFTLEKASIQVSAEGSINVMPDFIRIHIGIEKTGDGKANIKRDVDRITRQVLDAAQKLGIAEEHIEASQFSIQPHYDWRDRQRRLAGETVRRSVNIKLYDLTQYTALAAAMAKLDITRMQQQGFDFEDITEHHNQALVKALQQAQQKAELIAKTVGGKLGKVYQVVESSSTAPEHMSVRAMAMTEDSSEAPLDIKPQTVKANVRVIYLLQH